MFTILLVAVLNVGLGFALAVHMAHRCQRLVDGPPATEFWRPSPAPTESHVPPASAEPDRTDPAVALVPAAPSAERDPAELAAAMAPPEDRPVPAADVGAEPSEASFTSLCEQHVAELHGRVARYGRKLAELEGEFRTGAASDDPAQWASWIHSLVELNREHLNGRRPIWDALEKAGHEREEFHPLIEDLQEALREQASQIEHGEEALQARPHGAPWQQGHEQLLAETMRLLAANDRASDALGETAAGMDRLREPAESADDPPRVDELTGLLTRTGIEGKLASWWQRDPRHTRQISVAMIDVDHLGKLNEGFGHQAGTRVLAALAQIVSAEQGDSAVAARFAGEEFLVFLPDGDTRAAVALAERVRQAIEACHFRYQESDLRVTVSCGVAEATGQDTVESLLGRARATAREAKRYGGNRTFVHDGKCPSPVVPPNCAMSERTIAL